MSSVSAQDFLSSDIFICSCLLKTVWSMSSRHLSTAFSMYSLFPLYFHFTALETSLSIFAICFAKENSFHRPEASVLCILSVINPFSCYLFYEFPYLFVFYTPTPVALSRSYVYKWIVLYEIIVFHFRIKIDPPEIILLPHFIYIFLFQNIIP